MTDTTDVAGKRLSELLASPDSRSTAEEVLRSTIDKLFYVVVGLAAVSIGANTVRAHANGWHLSYWLGIGCFVFTAVLFAARRHLPALVVFWVVGGIGTLGGIVSLTMYGLGGTGLLILTGISMLAGVLFGMRVGLAVIGFNLAAVGVIGIFVCRRAAGQVADIDALLHAPSTWLIQGFAFAVYTISAGLAAEAVRRRFVQSRLELAERTQELRAAYHNLRAGEEKYRLIAENSTDLVFVQDRDLRLLYASPSAERLFGYNAEEWSKLSMEQWMTTESLERAYGAYAEYFQRAQEGPVTVPLMEFEYVRKNGTTFWGEMRVSFLYDDEGKITGSQGVLRDVTERKEAERRRIQLEEELRQSEKMRVIGQLAGGVAHDFNNQLAAIMGFADLTRRDPDCSTKSREYARLILNAAKRSADLTSKLLAFARKGKYRNVPVDVHKIIDETVEVLERSIGRHVKIKRHLDANPHSTVGDPSQLESAFLNLGLNARDAMPDGGEMVWETQVVVLDETFCRSNPYHPVPGPYVEVAVRDTGMGMSPELLERVFEPFFTTKDIGAGTGMGLAAVEGTIRNHQGALRVESRIGIGTTFRLFLPMVDYEEAGGPVIEEEAPNVMRSERIVVVDDEPLVCAMTATLVEQLGYPTDRFTDPHEALAFFRRNHRQTALLIVDLIMPGMGGDELCAHLREIDPDVRVLLCSGYDREENVRKAPACGALGFIAKPFNMDEMAEKLMDLPAGRED